MKKLTNAQKLILSNGSDNQNGSVLLFSIACIIVISTIGLMSFNFNSKERIISSNYKKNVQAFYLAEAGIEQAKAQLKDMSLQEIYDASQENDGYLFPSDTLGKGRYHVQIKGDLTPVDDPGFKIYYESRETPETTKEQDLTVSVITSEMQCPNGDEIYCKVEMSLDDGNNWIVLFNGDDVDGGESQTFSGVSVNSRIQFYIFAWNHDDNRYRHRYTNISDDEHFIYLKNGDITPDFLGAHSQTSIKDLLRENNFLDSSETYVVLKHNELLLCAELSNLGDWNDYQDIVLFLTFGATTNDSTTQSQEFIISSTGQQSNGIEETIEVMLKKMGNGHLEVLSWREIN